MRERATVAIVDDHPLIREGVAHILTRDGRFTVVAQGCCGRDAIKIASERRPELMLVDAHMPGGDGLGAIATITAKAPSVKVIVLTVSEEESDLVTALEAGARAYILKGTATQELLRIVGAVADGESYVTPGLAARAIMRMRKSTETVKPKAMNVSGLTSREGEILNAAAEGLTNKEVANRLGLSEKTVKHYMTSILDKLGVRNRVEAMLAAQRISMREV